MSLDVFLGSFVLADFLFLQIDGERDVRDAAERQGSPARRVDERSHMLRAHDLLVVDGDVLEQRQQINFLLVMRPEEVVVGLSRESKHRRAVELRVVQAIEQVDRPGPGSRQTHA
jgi:hypothetical protein